jgi:hypothetical protein
MHGAQGGAPEGERNGNYRHGRTRARSICLVLAALAAPLPFALPALAQSAVKIAVIMSQMGPSQTARVPVIDAVRLAVDEANAGDETPRIEFSVYDIINKSRTTPRSP